MQVFFVSIRTAIIYGPCELIEVFSPDPGIAIMTCQWPYDYTFGEWEGYAVVVPEREQVWGNAKPEVTEGELRARFEFTPMNIPGSDRKLFPKYPPKTEGAEPPESPDFSIEI